MARCTARSKRSGERCKRQASPGFTVCAMHGGKTPVGLAAASFKHGRYSRHLPTRLLGMYTDAMQDPQLVALQDDIALVDTRIQELITQIDRGHQPAQLWARALEGIGALRSAMEDEEEDRIESQLVSLERVLALGAEPSGVWQQILEAEEQKRKLAETDSRIHERRGHVLAIEHVMIVARALLVAVRENVPDRGALGRIQARFIEILGTRTQVTAGDSDA